jgi:hypothetical protein
MLGGYFFALLPFSGAGSLFPSAPSAVCVLWQFIVFQFCRVVRFWVLLTGSRNDSCDPLPALLWRVAYHQPAIDLPAFPVFVYWKFALRLAPFPSLSPVHFQQSCPLCCCSRLQFLRRGFAWSMVGVLGEFCVMSGTHLFVLSNVLQGAGSSSWSCGGGSGSHQIFSV